MISKGYKFKTKTDTEVVLASYIEWGQKCVLRFNGMWAFCIWDQNKNIFFLSRDRLGQKPLYYYNHKEKFIFSSEIKGILKHNIQPKINQDAVDLFFSMGFIPSPISIYENINKLEAGNSMIVNLKSAKIKMKQYWNPPIYKPTYNKKQLLSEFKDVLKDSVSLRMIADVEVGAWLSGGIDSSSIVEEMIRQKKKLRTYSLGFREGIDESKNIKCMVKYLGVDNKHEYFDKQDFQDSIGKIFNFYDEPFSDTSIFPTFKISKATKKDLTVVLTGDGGDEIFGGYTPHKVAAQLSLLRKIPKPLRRLMLKYLKPKSRKFRRLKEGIQLSLLKKEDIMSEARSNFYKPEVYKRITKKWFKKSLRLANGNLIEAFILYDRYFATLSDNYLCKVDRASMAHSLEARSPFLDHRFVELSSKIPTKWKTNGIQTKILMKEALKSRLPEQIIKGKKRGFSPPVETWTKEASFENEIKERYAKLKKLKIISSEWIEFLDKIFESKVNDYDRFKVRIYLFYEWLKKWKSDIKLN